MEARDSGTDIRSNSLILIDNDVAVLHSTSSSGEAQF